MPNHTQRNVCPSDPTRNNFWYLLLKLKVPRKNSYTLNMLYTDNIVLINETFVLLKIERKQKILFQLKKF